MSQRPKNRAPTPHKWPLTTYSSWTVAAGRRCGERGVAGDVEGRGEHGRAAQDRDGVDQSERRDRAGGERVDAAEQPEEPQGGQHLGQHDAELEHDAEPGERLVAREVGQRGARVVGDEELAADQQEAERP